MKKLLIIGVAVIAVLTVQVVIAERTPSAFLDSNPASLDTRVGMSLAVEELGLDSRTGSQDVSNLRGLNTTKVATSFIIR